MGQQVNHFKLACRASSVTAVFVARIGARKQLESQCLQTVANQQGRRFLVFDVAGGPALNASLIDMGNRFRLLVNEVEAVAPFEKLPNLPVARVLWKPLPDLNTGCAAWIYAGGAHHTVFSQNLTTEYFEDFAEMFNIELTVIDAKTELRQFKNELRWSEIYYK